MKEIIFITSFDCSKTVVMLVLLKVLLQCVLFLATCLPPPLRNKLLENCTVKKGLSRNIFQCASFRTALQEVEFKTTFRNALHIAPLHSVPLHSVTLLHHVSSQFLRHVFNNRTHGFIISL